MRAISGSTLVSIEETNTGLIVRGVIDNGTPPTTASLFIPGATVIDLSTGATYTNTGTTAVPVWYDRGQKMLQVSLAAADINGMYAAPVVLIPAVPGYSIILDSFEFDITRTSTAFANGGVVAPQYAATVHGAGTALTATLAATVVTGSAGRSVSARIPVNLSDVASTSIVGIGVYLSNATAAFDTGTGTAVATLRYHLV